MKNHDFMLTLIGFTVAFGILSIITYQIQWAVLVGGIIGTVVTKLVRKMSSKIRDQKDEIEYDERINDHMKNYITNTFFISNLLLLLYLIMGSYIFKISFIHADYLALYLIITFIIAFFIVPEIAKRK
ncbi:sodium/glutamate symporter family protein [Anoxybacillus sp. B7M1]|uniref:sodium/glutamate symporter n=1 Tax=unclassified Anoxybacillus TaxID=2639704 RepID=UPI0005CD0461|nr:MULTISPECIES: sodium/glutamate symporter [unclassified Anoxybacillus]ANB55753.1 sodium/glutamate symporter family protein [Anoxybacillus sp. B2M1]ANB65458.1 sodium/glutamate symporter family protein [Anoxybacillus sp. B7M1]